FRDSFAALAPVAPWLVFGAGMLLGWRFHRRQLVLALLVLFIADRLLVHVARASAPAGSPGRVVFTCVALLLPLDLTALAWMTEGSTRGPRRRWLVGALGALRRGRSAVGGGAPPAARVPVGGGVVGRGPAGGPAAGGAGRAGRRPAARRRARARGRAAAGRRGAGAPFGSEVF